MLQWPLLQWPHHASASAAVVCAAATTDLPPQPQWWWSFVLLPEWAEKDTRGGWVASQLGCLAGVSMMCVLLYLTCGLQLCWCRGPALIQPLSSCSVCICCDHYASRAGPKLLNRRCWHGCSTDRAHVWASAYFSCNQLPSATISCLHAVRQ